MKLVIKNIGLLVQARETVTDKISGSAMKQLPMMEDAWLFCEDGVFHSWGTMDRFRDAMHGVDPGQQATVIDAKEGMVVPSWCDSHTHIVHAGSREKEFVDRIHGLTYEEIARRGGGILNSSRKLSDTPEEVLLENALARVHEMMSFGTGAIEIKSGYGLSFEGELKMLRVIKNIKALVPVPVKATFLGAHAMPAEFRDR